MSAEAGFKPAARKNGPSLTSTNLTHQEPEV